MTRRSAIVIGVAATLVLAAPASASGADTIGSTLENPPNAFQGAELEFTFVHAANPAPLLASTDGVVVRWRVRDGNHPDDATVVLRVLVPNAGFTELTGAGTSAEETLPGSNGASDAMAPILTFPTRLPIAAGSTIGLTGTGSGRYRSLGLSSAYEKAVIPTPAEGDSSAIADGDPGTELLFNADIEPDADADGFGDETQDQCPTDASTQGPCDDGDDGGGGDDANDFSFGKVKKNKRRGTAKLTVNVPGAGELELAKTKKVKPDDESAGDAGKEKLTIKPKGKAKKKLNKKGKATVKANVTYTPDGGSPNTEDKKIKLVKR